MSTNEAVSDRSATPARRQWLHAKQQHPDCILLFRMGDFYETFDDDARLVARELEIALTSREMGRGGRIPMAGIPHHALDSYLARLIRRGHRVAICDQTSDPATSKGLVDREVIRVVTPGTVTEATLLDQKANTYLAAVCVSGDQAGVAYVDVSTAQFACAQVPMQKLPLEIERLGPAEVLLPESDDEPPPSLGSAHVTRVHPTTFHPELARQTLLEHFKVRTLEAFGCEGLPLAQRAAGAALEYVKRTQHAAAEHLDHLSTYSTERYMALDPQTRRNLELFAGGRWGQTSASLLSVLDFTRTPMGGRMLRRWIGQPLLDLDELHKRQDAVEFFHASALRREGAVKALSQVSDLERLVQRARMGTATPRDLIGLRRSVEALPALHALLLEGGERTKELAERLRPCPEVAEVIAAAIVDDPPPLLGTGDAVRPGFSADLDTIRAASKDARAFIAGLEQKERERSGIRSLKVGFNKVFGYYIEVTTPNLPSVPDYFIRKQTLTNGERYITPELKEYETLVLHGQERTEELERDLFRGVCQQVAAHAARVIEAADAVAHVDAFLSLAEAAARYQYTRPEVDDSDIAWIKEGRHPVVERLLPAGSFVANDVSLSASDAQVLLITGPNMAGKSTYIRMVAVLALMAQIGSFVPAERMRLGVVDRIFTRVGLQDDLAAGQSTFMVEMVETATILRQATRRSLVVLDEIGRGTSTHDGLAIARAVLEYVHNSPRLGCRTLFATHYHELTEAAKVLPRVRNATVAVAEEGEEIVFLHRIVPGRADKSYGVHVAQLAGMPRALVSRAWEVLEALEREAPSDGRRPGRRAAGQPAAQLPLLGDPTGVVDEVAEMDIPNMTPLEAINKLYELQRKARKGG